jgi:hypothetical protein
MVCELRGGEVVGGSALGFVQYHYYSGERPSEACSIELVTALSKLPRIASSEFSL